MAVEMVSCLKTVIANRSFVLGKCGSIFLKPEVFARRITFKPLFGHDCSRLSSTGPTAHDNSNEIQVYYGILTPQIRAVKIFSLCTSIGGLAAQPILLQQGANLASVPVLVAACTIVGFFTFVTPFLLHIITKKYVTEINYNSSSKEYTAVILNFFLRRKKILFKPEDVQVPEVPGMFTSFVAKGNPLFVEARLFEEPAHFAKIMGYDKPIDFKLENVSKKE